MTRNSDLHRLIYHSRNRIAGDLPETTAEIDRILAASRRNNAPLRVTGALIFNSGIFAQVLEGSRNGVEATFERIQCDPRHCDVHVLAFEPVEERSFPSWSMAFVGQSREGQELFAHIREATGFLGKLLEGDRVLRLMQEIAYEETARKAG
jgi:hypothetical protein